MPEVVNSKREMRVALRRRQILDAAARLFAERGFHLTTTRDIAEAAGVSEGTLYNYFQNKDDLLMGLMQNLVDVQQMQSNLTAALPQNPEQYLLSVLRSRRDFTNQNILYMQSIISEIFVNPGLRQRYFKEFYLPSVELLSEHLRERMALGQLGEKDAAMTSRLVIGILFGIFMMQILDDPLVTERWGELESAIVKVLIDQSLRGVEQL
jgi:AcrR family transcriptional regulator